MANPYAPPGEVTYDYAGFWIRFAAFVIDSIVVMIVLLPVIWWMKGAEYFRLYFQLAGEVAQPASALDIVIQYVFPAVAIIIFWLTKQATPGKMLLSLRVVDARTGGKLSVGQAIGRYLAYYLSTIVFCLGFFWIGFDARKQGWHDKLAGTLVIRGGK